MLHSDHRRRCPRRHNDKVGLCDQGRQILHIIYLKVKLSATNSARSRVRLVRGTFFGPRLTRFLQVTFPIFPVPTRRIFLSARLSKVRVANLTAAYATVAAPLPREVSFLDRLCARKTFCIRRCSSPDSISWLEAISYPSLTCFTI